MHVGKEVEGWLEGCPLGCVDGRPVGKKTQEVAPFCKVVVPAAHDWHEVWPEKGL